MTPKHFTPTFRTSTGKTVSFAASTTNDVAAKKRAGRTKAGVPTIPPPVLADEFRLPEPQPEHHQNDGIPAAPVAIFTLNLLAVGWAYAAHELGTAAGSLASALVLYLLVSAIVKPKRRRHDR